MIFDCFLRKEMYTEWRKHVRGPNGAAKQFWNSMLETEFVRRHPRLRSADFHHIIPIGFHGGGGSDTDHDSIYVFS